MERVSILSLILILFISGCISPAVVVNKTPQEFNISISSSGSCYINDGNFTIFLMKNGTDLINWTTPLLNFTIEPVTPPGSTASDRTTFFFSVEEYESQLLKFRDLPQIIWEMDENMYLVEGIKTMGYLQKKSLNLTFDFNLYELQQTSDSSMKIKFSNIDDTWTKYYNVTLRVINLT